MNKNYPNSIYSLTGAITYPMLKYFSTIIGRDRDTLTRVFDLLNSLYLEGYHDGAFTVIQLLYDITDSHLPEAEAIQKNSELMDEFLLSFLLDFENFITEMIF
ncbi:hypothetical protein LJC32_01225 [Oscillospiraceae bacterium OttesenSCG-928-F05]|nr:hypothetical protein [Oscillospiraceae bacterium OttesenSCG-928-F05]